jgi:hypothetical protein
MKRIITVMALAATMLLASASMAIAGGPNDSEECLHWANHGVHIQEYVATGGTPGGTAAGGGAAHFGVHEGDPTPGATFCQGDGNNAPPLNGTPGRFA